MSEIEVLIADDQALMRDGLKTILELEAEIKIVGVAENGEQAYKLAEKLKPDLILMDIRMPKMNGIESTRLIKNQYPEIKILALTTFDDREYIVDILNYGAEGYLLKDIDGDKLVTVIKDAVAGDLIMPAKIATKLAKKELSEAENKESKADKKEQKSESEEKLKDLDLSDREQEVALMLAQGFSNKQIASALYISHGTVKNYVSSIYAKIGINDRTKAALYLKEKFN